MGINLYTTVTDDYAKGDNAFTGTINSVRIDVDDSADPTRRSLADPELVLHPAAEVAGRRHPRRPHAGRSTMG